MIDIEHSRARVDARLEQRVPEPPSPPEGPVVTVMLGSDTVFRVGGGGALVSRMPAEHHRVLVAALLAALTIAHSTAPERSALTEASEALDGLTAALNPSDAGEVTTALAGPILARCNILIAAGKAHFQS